MDATPLLYLKNPDEAFASVTITVLLRQLGLGALIIGIFTFAYFKWLSPIISRFKKEGFKTFLVFLFVLALLFIPIRGSFTVSPINISSAYFHQEPFANHAAINELWNFTYALTEMEVDKNPYNFLDDDKANAHFPVTGKHDVDLEGILKIERPNVLLFIVESFSAKVLEPYGGWEGITPRMNKSCDESIVFKNVYASGCRTDKGLVAILSGFPALPTNSIIKYPDKVQKLPFLSRDLEQVGYQTAFYYGGDVNFANMRSYLLTGKFQVIVDMFDFPKKLHASKWGVHDEFLLQKVMDRCQQATYPFFKTVLTLSSHEPFDVPLESKYAGADEFSRYLNAVYYTDSCLGEFITTAKQSEWWDSTLIVITADHGVRHPRSNPIFFPGNFKIPFIFTGGAVKLQDTVILNQGSQIDIPYTLLKILGIETSAYPYSKNLLNDNNEFAYFAYNKGFGFVTDSSTYTYDLNTREPFYWSGIVNKQDVLAGKSFLQISFQDFLDK
jgi:phosphoglycerol transferase MdoB-like AlkP superfamily enzyme